MFRGSIPVKSDDLVSRKLRLSTLGDSMAADVGVSNHVIKGLAFLSRNTHSEALSRRIQAVLRMV